MAHRITRTVPPRMVVLSLLPPPRASESLHPFGFGAFIVTRHSRNEAQFVLRVQGYGAGYDPHRMRRDLRSLFTPDTRALIYAPAATHGLGGSYRPAIPSHAILDLVPRSGLLANAFAALPHDMLAHAAGLAELDAPARDPSPLQRLRHLGAEAQAVWVYWLFKSCTPRLRRDLLASHAAWRVIERVRGRGRSRQIAQ